MKLLIVWTLALLLLAAAASAAFAQPASWLDAPPRGWNAAGMANPPPAPALQNSAPRCSSGGRRGGCPPGAHEG